MHSVGHVVFLKCNDQLGRLSENRFIYVTCQLADIFSGILFSYDWHVYFFLLLTLTCVFFFLLVMIVFFFVFFFGVFKWIREEPLKMFQKNKRSQFVISLHYNCRNQFYWAKSDNGTELNRFVDWSCKINLLKKQPSFPSALAWFTHPLLFMLSCHRFEFNLNSFTDFIGYYWLLVIKIS